MNNYELTLVLDGKSGAAKKKKLVESVEKILATFSGKIKETKDWGVKELSYKLGKSETGLYTFIEFSMNADGAKALNEKLRTDSDVLRFLLIKTSK